MISRAIKFRVNKIEKVILIMILNYYLMIT